jgi:hypothetical protein
LPRAAVASVVPRPHFDLSDFGGYLLLVTAVLAFFLGRLSSIVTLAAGLLCLPLYLYAIAPGIFPRVFPW